MDTAASLEKLKEYFEQNKLQVGLALLGLFLLLGGIFLNQGRGRKSSVEIIPAEPSAELRVDERIIVDVEGAVEQAGVYELEIGARVNDALTAAGGMSEEADRGWVRRFVNLAQIVPDGSKIYIPALGESYSEEVLKGESFSDNGGVTGVSTIGLNGSDKGKININSASQASLDSLWGIGEKRASDIVNGRPYSDIGELKTKAKIPSNVFERIEGEIIVQ